MRRLIDTITTVISKYEISENQWSDDTPLELVNLLDLLDEIKTHLENLPTTEWQPMEDMPISLRDGRMVLLLTHGGIPITAYYDEATEQWYQWGGRGHSEDIFQAWAEINNTEPWKARR